MMRTMEQRAESRVRRLAARHGYRVCKSRAMLSLDNRGEYMLIENARNIPMLGWQFDASLDEIERYFTEVD